MQTSLKTCFKCGAEKPLTEFYKHPKMKDGRVNKCKECNKKDVVENRKDKIDYYRNYDRKRGNRQDKSYLKDYRSRYPNKYKAHILVNNYLRDGKLFKIDNCEVCSSDYSVVAHHDDYLNPLSVRWLCQACHKQWHSINGEGENP